jgi:hypothetical protein
MKHKIRTAFGDSTDSYGGEAWTMPLPPQGIYQGNGVGPTAWLIISSNLLDIMRLLGFGTFFKATISWDTLLVAGFSYVDDTDLTQSTTPTVTMAEEVFEKIHEGLNTWEGLVRASGGVLSNDCPMTKAAGGTSTLPLIIKATGGTKRWKNLKANLLLLTLMAPEKH